MQLHNLHLWVYERNSLQRGISKQKPQNQQQPHYVTRKSYVRQHPVMFVQQNAVYSREEGCELSTQPLASETMKRVRASLNSFKMTAQLFCFTLFIIVQ